MMKDFITIADRQYRVEANWNATVAYLEATGKDNFEALALFGNFKPSDVAPLMVACVAEGERLEGRESDLTVERVGELCDFEIMTEFMRIYGKQINPQTGEEPKKD